jgi:hypothetical protein
VRGAGFPAAEVLRIADAECAAAADRLAAVAEEAETLRQAAREALRGEPATEGREQLDHLVQANRRVRRRVKQGRPVSTEGLAAGTAAAVDAWKAAAGRLEAEKARYQEVFAAAEERLDRELREIARGERFREAMVWQNRFAVETGLAPFLRRPAEDTRRSARDRAQARLLASYLQRYCTKNDSIGFFGPVGWGRLDGEGEAVAARPGKELLAARQVYFEGWAIDAIADRLAEDEAMRPWLAPRLSPFLRREGNAYVTPNGDTIQLGPLSAALLAACDGTRPARALIRGLGPELPADKEAILWSLLADLHAKGALRWAFQIPMGLTPERTLRDLLLAIEEEPLRERSLALLDEIERGRAAVVRAAGNAEELERALGELEATFTRVTGRRATRAEGQTYGGRTLVYEDCRRDLDLELGAPFLADLAPALALVLASARWLTHFVATDHRERFAQVYAELAPQGGPVDFLAFSRAALPRVVNKQVQQEIQRELYERWARVLQVPDGERRVSYRSEDLRARARQEFAAPGPGWQKARYHSPDLLIAAPSLDAIRQGDYQVVLGEMHVAINSLDRGVLFAQHPHPEELRDAIEADLPEPSLIPVFCKKWNQVAATSDLGLWAPVASGRTDVALRAAKDFYLDLSLDPPGAPAAHLLPIADLVVERGANGFIVRPRDGRVSFDIIDFYQLAVMIQVLATYRMLPAGSYTPRITIDRLVVTRESWRVPAGELAFAQEPTAAERFAAARHWAGRRGLPRFLFAKTPGEVKPFYVDLESPVLVENLAKAIRGAAAVDPSAAVYLVEMLPDHGQLWLPDAQGNRYTCELRMVALDLG